MTTQPLMPTRINDRLKATAPRWGLADSALPSTLLPRALRPSRRDDASLDFFYAREEARSSVDRLGGLARSAHGGKGVSTAEVAELRIIRDHLDQIVSALEAQAS